MRVDLILKISAIITNINVLNSPKRVSDWIKKNIYMVFIKAQGHTKTESKSDFKKIYLRN